MIEKIKNIVSSIRFYEIVVATTLIVLSHYGIVPEILANAIASVLGISVAINTVDRFGEKVGNKQ